MADMEDRSEMTIEEPKPCKRSNIRVRGRTLSSGRAEDIVTAEQKARQLQPDRPIHSPCDSLLSWSSSFTKYEGMLNWGALLLFLSSLRVFLENLLKYGVRVSPTKVIKFLYGAERPSLEFPVLYLFSFSLVPAINAWLIEILLARTVLDWTTGLECL